ncbi:TetR/AcrR family transcriptional regulator [Subtercola endophyticus]|uniref:TetR/AcrR family transcriptional regulator n=1 Tax=Subtercola endophyticus TaxID=2895559 RepID=UPI001E38465D|nr:TetR/AcrR family transcriptional regulator [Subtercola endophyticus]UFS57552.1 TetR/AcrR family transcriptional regulator [Subtercola endophyticus]
MAKTSAPSTPKRSARDRLLAASDELFYTEGIHTVGIDRVIEKAGVAKGSLYYIFGGKDQLIEAYLFNRHQAWMHTVQQGLDAVDEPQAKILAVFDQLGTLFAQPDFRGCAFMNATAEALPGSPEDRAATKFRGWIHELFGELAGAAGATDPKALADQLVVLYDGANTTAQMDKTAAPARTAKTMAQLVLTATPFDPPRVS